MACQLLLGLVEDKAGEKMTYHLSVACLLEVVREKSFTASSTSRDLWLKGRSSPADPKTGELVIPWSEGLVVYHLSPCRPPSWSKVFEREPARRMADKVAWHRTPKPGRWLNRAAIKLGVRSRQCLGHRWESLEEIEHPVGQEHKEWIERAAKMH
jgi:hypothetical protein